MKSLGKDLVVDDDCDEAISVYVFSFPETFKERMSDENDLAFQVFVPLFSRMIGITLR